MPIAIEHLEIDIVAPPPDAARERDAEQKADALQQAANAIAERERLERLRVD